MESVAAGKRVKLGWDELGCRWPKFSWLYLEALLEILGLLLHC